MGCAVSSCRKAGHFPCLHKLGFTFHYGGKFEAYCPKHSPTQHRLRDTDRKGCDCCICFAPLSGCINVYCPCCVTVFHKSCIQVSNYIVNEMLSSLILLETSFECWLLLFPLSCLQKQRNFLPGDAANRDFHTRKVCSMYMCMVRCALYLHDRDAKWEVGTDYLNEELKCKAESCVCPHGRSHHSQLGYESYITGKVKTYQYNYVTGNGV